MGLTPTFDKEPLLRTSSLLQHFTKNWFTAFVAIVALFSITAFISVEKTTPNNLLNPGVVFEVEVTYYEQSTPQTEITQMAVEGPNLKMNIIPRDGEDNGGKVIFRGNRGENGEFIVVDDDRKEYYLIDDAFIKMLMSWLGGLDERDADRARVSGRSSDGLQWRDRRDHVRDYR